MRERGRESESVRQTERDRQIDRQRQNMDACCVYKDRPRNCLQSKTDSGTDRQTETEYGRLLCLQRQAQELFAEQDRLRNRQTDRDRIWTLAVSTKTDPGAVCRARQSQEQTDGRTETEREHASQQIYTHWRQQGFLHSRYNAIVVLHCSLYYQP